MIGSKCRDAQTQMVLDPIIDSLVFGAVRVWRDDPEPAGPQHGTMPRPTAGLSGPSRTIRVEPLPRPAKTNPSPHPSPRREKRRQKART
jgi:hypothetical protein